MSEAYDEAMVELHELYQDLLREAEMPHYGFFLGGDPRQFTPDPECSTPEERAAHDLSCHHWNNGNRVEVPMPQCMRGNGEVGFGLGTSVVEDPVAADAAERLGRIINRLEQP